ncbi:MAG: DoxX family protein [Alphaproteobacteria bacterium]
MSVIRFFTRLHNAVFSGIERALGGWFPGLAARLVFASVLLLYFYNSAKTKIGDGLFGFLSISDGAYFQIVAPVVERFEFDPSQVPFLPYGLIVLLGTYSEFILPTLIVLGLFTRVAALGMVIFIAVQSFVDVTVHGLEEKSIGAMFDRFPDAVIADQRLLWAFPLVYLVVRGAGAVSLDTLLWRRGAAARESQMMPEAAE